MPYTLNSGQKSMSDVAIDLILKDIREGQLQPGDRMPSEREMSAMYGIGRQSIREAIKVLRMMNILEVRHQGGTFLAKSNLGSKYDFFKFYLNSGQISTSEIFETRLILEQECVALAAENMTEEQLAIIKKSVESADVDAPDGFAEADRLLHDTIYEATGNRALQLLMQTVKMWTLVSQGVTNSYREVRQIVQKDHMDIYKALNKKDAQLCREAMKQHIFHLNHIHYLSETLMRHELRKLLEKADTLAQR